MTRRLSQRLDDVERYGRNAASMIGQIEYWLHRAKGHKRCVVRRGNHSWVAKTREDWCRETGLTMKQVRVALERLEAFGVLVRERHKMGENVVAFLRLEGRPEEAQEGQSGVAAKGHSGMAQEGRSYMSPTETDIEFEIEEESMATASQVRGKKSEVSERKKGMARPKSLLAGYSVKEIQAAGRMQAQSAPVSARDAKTPGQLGLVWKRAWSEALKEYGGNLTSKQEGQLRMAAEKCPRGEGGQVIDFAVRNWSLFVAVASVRQGAFRAPELPCPSFLLRFVQSAVQSWQESRGGEEEPLSATPKPTKAWKVPKKTQSAPQVDADKPVTDLDEAAKLLGL